MATTTERPSSSELLEARAKREAEEERKAQAARDQAAMEEAREQAQAEREAAARSRTGPDAQDGLFDQEIENAELEAALEAREKVKASRSALNAKFKEADETAKGLIAGLDLDVDTVIRVGRFRISKTATEGRSVAFETEPGARLTISLLD